MIEEDLEVAIKVVVVGNGAVGKSSLIQRYCKGSFTKDYKKTIGVDFLERQLKLVMCMEIFKIFCSVASMILTTSKKLCGVSIRFARFVHVITFF